MSVQLKNISDSIDYSNVQRPYAHSSWSLQKQAFDNGNSLTVSAAGGDISRVLLNPGGRAHHPQEDILRFTLTPTAPGTGTRFNYMHSSQIAIQTLQLNTVSGIQIENLQNLNYMLNALTLPQTSFAEFQSFNGNIITSNSNYVEIAPFVSHLIGTALTVGGRIPGNVASSTPYMERQYAVVGGDNTATPVVNFAFRMKNLPPSIFTIDQAVYWTEPLELILTWDNPKNVYWTARSATDYDTNAEAWLGTTVAVTNLTYYMALENNPEINASLRAQAMSPEGLSILKPHMTSYRQVTPVSTQPALNYNIGSSLGMRLQKIFTVCYAATLTVQNTFDHRQVADAKITNFYSLINNTYTTSIAPVTVGVEDWMLLKPHMAGCALADQLTYNANWVWCDVFDGDADGNRKLYNKSAVDAGMDLTQGAINFQFQATTASASYTWFVFIQTLRKLNISSAGVRIM